MAAKVTVKPVKIIPVAQATDLAIGTTQALFRVAPADKVLACTSSNPEVATVDEHGNVTAVAEGTATITAKSKYGNTATVDVTVKKEIYSLAITSLEVKAADTLVATFASAVKTADTTITLKRGTTTVEQKVTWNEDATVATIKTSARMTTGTYEVTATDKNDATITASKTAEVEAQKATEVVILNDVALTGPKTVSGFSVEYMQAFVYYDVKDQYGESMRNAVNIEWNTSVKVVNKNTTSGMLTLERNDGKAFTYGEQIYVTGVYTKTGLTVSKTLTIGAAQAVNSVKIGGFIKKGTTTVLDKLPKDFKSDAYYMLYNVVDQNGNDMKTGRVEQGDDIKDITFVSDKPLIISEMKYAGPVMTVNDNEYDTVLVKPGIKVEEGGEVTVTAIANKTGNKTVLNVPVNVSEVLKSFVIGTPSDIVTDGQTGVELPFTATNTAGQTVTNFEIIAKQATFNKLQLTTSAGKLVLGQNNDGTAKLVYNDPAMSWEDSQATDGQQRVVSLTAIVVGGETNNQMLNIDDKARPNGIKNVSFRSAYVEGDTATVMLTGKDDVVEIAYVDQYGRNISNTDPNRNELNYNYLYGNSAEAFFKATENKKVQGSEFAGYVYGTLVTYNGNGKSVLNGAEALVSDGKKDVFLTSTDDKAVITMGNDILSVASGEGCKFSVAKLKDNVYSALDRAKNFTYAVVDITKVTGLKVDNIGKIFVQTENTPNDYLVDATTGTALKATIPAKGEYNSNDYTAVVKVSGSYAGKDDVRIPDFYYSYVGNVLCAKDGGNKINAVSTGAITAKTLYNFGGITNNFTRKDGEDLLTVTVYEVYDKDGKNLATKKEYSALKKNVVFSDKAPEGTTLNASTESMVMCPEVTTLSINKDMKWNNKLVFELLDQYGKPFAGMKFEVKDVKEYADAYADNNFASQSNVNENVFVGGAERCDTFTIVASFDKLSASVSVTVGADKMAYIDDKENAYLTKLIGDGKAYGLESQRLDGLK